MTSRVASIVVVVLGLVAGSGCGDKSKTPGCKTEADCKDGLHCVANKCVECGEDSHCGPGKKCSANACIVSTECERDDQCPDGKVCQAGRCTACASDNECGPEGRCEDGACKRTKCTKDEDCADDEDCVNGFCRRAGGTSNPGDVSCAMSTVYFGFDDSTIQASERDRLESNASCLEKTKGKTILVVGNTDTSGTEEYNIALSERRARSVADFMSRLGSDPARMQVVPKGETESTGLGDDKDRRVEFLWR
ncbi:MAG: OmpA family protein [Kofleriaceae bacterium]